MVAERTVLYGEVQDSERQMDQLFVRLSGARGSSDIHANTLDGSITVVSERATTTGLLNALHRGEQAGATWRMFIDVVAGLFIVLSLIGYAIFFSISNRLTTALLITGGSVLGIAIFCIAVVRDAKTSPVPLRTTADRIVTPPTHRKRPALIARPEACPVKGA